MKTITINLNRIFYFAISIILFTSCSDEATEEKKTVENANFSTKTKTIYLTKSITFEAESPSENKNYYWDFGDGIKIVDGYKVTHRFEKPGIHTVKLEIDGLISTQKIRVYPGTVSYQIKNETDTELDMLTYINNWQEGNVFRKGISGKTISDTIYATVDFNPFNALLLLEGSVIIHNQEYMLYRPKKMNWVKNFNHHILIIADTTKVDKRMRYGNEPENPLELKTLIYK